MLILCAMPKLGNVKDLRGQVFGNWLVVGGPRRNKWKSGRSIYYWESRCQNCGVIKDVPRTSLTSAAKHSACRNCWLMPQGESGMNRMRDYYQRNAKKRGISFRLSSEEFRKLTSGDCYYCGVEPSGLIACNEEKSNKKSHWGDYVFNGIDRIDNAKGYRKKNCVSCCLVCNRARNNMSFDEFVAHLSRIRRGGGAVFN